MVEKLSLETKPAHGEDFPLVLDVKQAGELLGLSHFTVREFARDGKIPAKKVGKAWRFSRDGLIRWLETPDPYRHRPGRRPKAADQPEE